MFDPCLGDRVGLQAFGLGHGLVGLGGYKGHLGQDVPGIGFRAFGLWHHSRRAGCRGHGSRVSPRQEGCPGGSHLGSQGRLTPRGGKEATTVDLTP